MVWIALALGLLLWTLLEYALHRFVFHARVLGPGHAGASACATRHQRARIEAREG